MSTCSELKKASLQLKSIVKEKDFCNRNKVEDSINTLLVSLDYLYMEKSYSEISKKTYNKVETFIENAICNLKKSLKIDCQSSSKEIEKKIKKAICYISKSKRCLNCKDCPIVPVCSYINNAQIPPVPYSLDPLNVSASLADGFLLSSFGYLYGNLFFEIDGTIFPLRLEIANRYLKSDFDGKKIDSVQFGFFNSPKYRGENKDYNLIFKIYDSNNLQNVPDAILSSVSIPVSSLVFLPGPVELGVDIQVCIVSIPLSVAIQKIIGKYFFVAVNFEEGNNDFENKFLTGLLNTSNAAFNPTWRKRPNGEWSPIQGSKETLYTFEVIESDVWINPLLCPYEEPFPRKDFFGKVYYGCDIQVGIPNVSIWAWAPGYGDSNAPYAVFPTDENGNWRKTLPEGTPPVSWTFSVRIPDDGHVSDWICVTSNQVQVVNPSDPTTTIPVGFLADKINVSGKVNRTCNLEIFKEGELKGVNKFEELKSGLVKKTEKQNNFQTVSLFSDIKNLSELTDSLIVPINILGEEKKLKVVRNNVYSFLRVENMEQRNNYHYNGIIEDDENSLVALNIHDGKVNGLISNSKYGNLEIRYENGEYKFVKTGNSGFKCWLEDNLSPLDLDINVSTQSAQERCVEVWLDVGNNIYNLFEGDLIRVTNYIEDLMNIVSSIYEVENVNLKLGEFKIWETLEPFFGENDSATLNDYRNYRRPGGDGDDWVGDVAHYIKFGSQSGIAFLNGLCNRNTSYGVNNITTLAINPYPEYFWGAYVLAHELGHSLGSRHTFSCTWPNGYLSNPGAIDGSSVTEGNCLLPPFPEINQRTIMGYANNYPLSNAFGTPLGGIYVQPGNVIRNTVANATCVSCDDACPILVRTSSIIPAGFGLSNGSITITVSGATSYNFLWSNGAVTQNINNIPCGLYSVTVTDSNNPDCSVTLENIVVPTSLEDIRVNVNVKGGPCNIDESVVLTGSKIDYLFNLDPIFKGILDSAKRIYTVTITRLENTTKFTSVFGVPGDNFQTSVSKEIDINTLFVSSLSQILGVTSVQ